MVGTGIIEDNTFMRPWENLPETIYARPLVKPGDKVRHSLSPSVFDPNHSDSPIWFAVPFP